MYALVNGQQLILGPIAFNYRMINSALEEELELPNKVSIEDYKRVPFTITGDVKLLNARNNIPNNDPRFQEATQTSYTITSTEVIFNYTIRDKPLQQIKNEYKKLLTPERKRREELPTEVTVRNKTFNVETSKERRTQYVLKIMSGRGSYNYKFNDDNWLKVTNNDLQNVVYAIDTTVQAAYDWEFAKAQEIDACTTKEAVYDVEIVPPSGINSFLRPI